MFSRTGPFRVASAKHAFLWKKPYQQVSRARGVSAGVFDATDGNGLAFTPRSTALETILVLRSIWSTGTANVAQRAILGAEYKPYAPQGAEKIGRCRMPAAPPFLAFFSQAAANLSTVRLPLGSLRGTTSGHQRCLNPAEQVVDFGAEQ